MGYFYSTLIGRLVMLIFVACVALASVGNSYQSLDTNEQRLLSQLLRNYSVNSRPVTIASESVKVYVIMEIVRIDTVSEKGQSMRTKLHVSYSWKNPLLKWNPEYYGNVTEVIIQKSMIWTPPVHLFNEASRSHGELPEHRYEHTVVLTHDGNCSLSYAQFFKSTCEINVSDFPFDEQDCDLVFGSWSMDKRLLLLVASNGNAKGVEYKENGEWELASAKAESTNLKYHIQTRQHSVIKVKVNIKRKHFFFVMNLVVPCALIACMIFLVFVLPPKSGERISLGITVMLSMAIFQELSSEKLPSSSDNYPLLGVYYSTSMFEIGIALIMNCFILNLYYRNYKMAPWVRRLVLGKLAKIVRVAVPLNRTQEYLDNNIDHNSRDLALSNLSETTMNNMKNGNDNDSGISVSNGTKDLTYFPTSTIMRDEHQPIKRSRTAIFITRNNTRKDQTGSDARHRMMSTQSSLPLMCEDNQKNNGRKLLEEDWKLVARVADRCMLLLSITVGVLSTFTIFIQARRFRKVFTG